MRTRILLRLGVVTLLGFLALSFAAGVFEAEGTLHPRRRSLSAKDEMQAREMARSHDSDLTNADITARDGATLSAWSIRPRNSNGKAVILLHGQGDNRLGMIGYAELLLSHSFSVLMPDARAHGASGGQLATYGLLESDDIHRWLDWLQRNQYPTCIFGFAESMGAAQLLQSLHAESRFCAVAAESPFASFREIAYDRVGQFFRTGPWLGRTILRPVVEVAFGYARWKYKLNFEQVSPERVVSTTKIPVFLIHGRNDKNIPIRHSRLIATDNPALTLWEVPDTDHCGAISSARNEFERRLTRWFDEHSGNDLIRSGTLLDQRYRPKPNRPMISNIPSELLSLPERATSVCQLPDPVPLNGGSAAL
jgi:pimeloyl-ACP methyl ester carboxylesterase